MLNIEYSLVLIIKNNCTYSFLYIMLTWSIQRVTNTIVSIFFFSRCSHGEKLEQFRDSSEHFFCQKCVSVRVWVCVCFFFFLLKQFLDGYGLCSARRS